MKIIKRNGSEADFDISKIAAAITKANEAGGAKKELHAHKSKKYQNMLNLSSERQTGHYRLKRYKI